MNERYPVFINQVTGELTSGPPPCKACNGVCCSTASGHRFVQLTYTEQQNPRFKSVLTKHKEAGVMGFWFKGDNEGSGGGFCPFFSMTERACSIYEERPQNCRNYDCRANPLRGTFFERNPDVLALIRQQS